ncbi:1-phosphofructokinase [Planococcus rifietoensis]|uniref:Tagatose-6-phosphate kinase n=1 Tax=Planococcus rifietoensis TaxID=200991 RepID=A0A0U2Q630_9BACL|nr:1-phosphofructokinase [Planococcus rifietoensis]ALS73990.1 1-phosphofructokinase [Planococcus rifietoensis]
MIYTCTFAPSIDYTAYLTHFESGALNRSDEVYYYPGGKGINVSRVLSRLGLKSRALGYAGGFTGRFIEEFLDAEGIETDFIDTGAITRINVKIKTDQETELNGPGPVLEGSQLEQLKEKIAVMAQGDWFVLAGSLPSSVPTQFFKDLADRCQERGIHFVLDTSGPALQELLDTKPFLIKPNEHELGEMFGVEITTQAQAFHYASRLVERGVQHVVVSMGGAGAIYASREHRYTAQVPKGKVVNTVGSGDSLVSGFIASYIQHQDPERAFQYGVASGSATAFRTDLCEQADVEQLLPEVTVTPFEEKDVTK